MLSTTSTTSAPICHHSYLYPFRFPQPTLYKWLPCAFNYMQSAYILCLRRSENSDLFSFILLMWEVCHLQNVFSGRTWSQSLLILFSLGTDFPFGDGGVGNGIKILKCLEGASQVVLVVKNPPANAGDIRDMGSIPVTGRSPGGQQGNPLQCSGLENPMDRGAWQATVHRVTKRRT